ncbi:ferritin family protein [Evansella sp. AB-rgal1]|uniref:ferritin family protein n=1 Tax=Evansella sp. AB-rgal1 TaxID=3242696 RepID=UPI00359D6EEF
MYPSRHDAQLGGNQAFLNDLKKAIDGEYTAVTWYKTMEKMAPTNKQKEKLKLIRKDEEKHYNQFSYLHYSLTGQQYQPKLTRECPSNHLEAIRAAFVDEQETTDFYLNISDYQMQQSIKDMFRRAAADEQNHAVWFLHFHFISSFRNNVVFNDNWHI